MGTEVAPVAETQAQMFVSLDVTFGATTTGPSTARTAGRATGTRARRTRAKASDAAAGSALHDAGGAW